MFAVTGITGHVGRAAATHLLKQNQPVRAIVRSMAKGKEWQHKGAEIALADFFDTDLLTKAFEGANAVFIMTPPALDLEHPIEQHLQMLNSIVNALKMTKPQKIVYLSSIGGHLEKGTGAIRKLYDMEQALVQLDIPTAAIRAGWFMENFIGLIPGAIQSGTMLSFLDPTDLRIPMVAVEDIGKIAAELLMQAWQGHRIIELEGPFAYSADNVAHAIGRISGKKISAIPIPRADYENIYSSFGFTPNASRLMAEMNDGFNTQRIVFEGENTEHICGQTSLEEMLHKHIV